MRCSTNLGPYLPGMPQHGTPSNRTKANMKKGGKINSMNGQKIMKHGGDNLQDLHMSSLRPSNWGFLNSHLWWVKLSVRRPSFCDNCVSVYHPAALGIAKHVTVVALEPATSSAWLL